MHFFKGKVEMRDFFPSILFIFKKTLMFYKIDKTYSGTCPSSLTIFVIFVGEEFTGQLQGKNEKKNILTTSFRNIFYTGLKKIIF